MKKERILLLLSTVATLVVCLLVIRWLAPGLLGLPTDLQLVQLDDKLPSFYEGVFRRDNFSGDDVLLQDPLTRYRGRPLLSRTPRLGPHDILGFRNYSVPSVTDVITIGDSMTYGNNALLEDNWPSLMRAGLKDSDVYNMSTGGWAAVQYLDMFTNATLLRPRVIVIAFYSGNDPLESFQSAYGIDHWSWLATDKTLDMSDLPNVAFPAPESEQWQVSFADGVTTIFTPTLRLASNLESPAVTAGYEIMANVVRHIGAQTGQLASRILFTIIPTKELVYAEKVKREDLAPPADYTQLVESEKRNIDNLAAVITSTPGVEYIDVLTPMQNAALGSVSLYQSDINGHPVESGYQVIADAIGTTVAKYLPEKKKGRVALRTSEGYSLYLINGEGLWQFGSPEIMQKNGWPEGDVPVIEPRDIAGMPYHGTIRTQDPGRFGPGQETAHDSSGAGLVLGEKH